ncbi:MAG: triose-phosphate isomerase [Buchnera aphidicola (Schlechtendalia peitan)]
MKKKFIIANWKLNGSKELLNNLLIPMVDFVNINKITSTLIIVPPFVYLDRAYNIVMNTNIMIGAQNVDIHSSGAYTGEISIAMLNDINVKYVMIGHSERRLYHKENDLLIAKKFYIIKSYKLIPIFCIGETEQDYKSHMTKKICQQQIDVIFNSIGEHAFHNTIIAYEPIWAIGSGKIPSIAFIQDVCIFITSYILNKQKTSKKSFFIQYGGSIDENNIKELCTISGIDGFLIGSASLSISRFLKILNVVSHS